MCYEKNKQWFENWFDSPYYHILYKQRDFCEAELFIDNLINQLKPKPGARFLDVGCGKGRHSIYLNKKGYNVVGIDLSLESISFASTFGNDNLQFYVEDMRNFECSDKFDYALNLFNCVYNSLLPNGIFVLDFMNAQKEIAELIQNEKKTIDGIEFKISRFFENNFIIKKINFSDQGKEYNFQERVKAINLNDFRKYFDANRLKIVNLLGNYKLEKFNAETSDRLIIIAQKE